MLLSRLNDVRFGGFIVCIVFSPLADLRRFRRRDFSIGELSGAVNYEINGLAGYIDCFLSMKQHPLIKYNDGE